jgi:hypothetical protein
MPDEPSGQPASDAGNSGQQNTDWKARFDGQVKKIEQLVTGQRDLEAQLATKTSECEQLKAQLGIKDTEKNVAISERDKRLQEALTAKSTLDAELSDLRAYKLKVDVAKELGHPNLLKIIDKIPNMTDREALKSVLSEFAEFARDAAKERETALLSGVTPGLQNNQPPQINVPTSDEGWMKLLNDKPLGSPERQKVYDEYWTWLEVKNNPK